MWKALTNHISQERFTGVQGIAEGMDVRFSYTIEGLLFPLGSSPHATAGNFLSIFRRVAELEQGS